MKKLPIILVLAVMLCMLCPTVFAADGYVNLSIYIYADGQLASGYRAQIDETVLVSDENGKVTFTELTVEPHEITFTNKDGKTSVGNLNLVPGGNTALIDAAMGGNFDVEIANSANDAYMEVNFIPEFHFDITSISENKPTLPEKTKAPDSEQSTAPKDEPKDEKEESGGFSISPTLLLIIILICVIIIVALVLMLKRKTPPQTKPDENTSAKTGGKNKFEDRSKL